MSAIVDAGYPYEIAGLVFYVFFISMTRRAGGPRYAQHTRVLTIAAAIGLVGVVPFHYAGNPAVMFVVLLIAVAALVSAFLDARGARR
jgi:hypothetical protein